MWALHKWGGDGLSGLMSQVENYSSTLVLGEANYLYKGFEKALLPVLALKRGEPM